MIDTLISYISHGFGTGLFMGAFAWLIGYCFFGMIQFFRDLSS